MRLIDADALHEAMVFAVYDYNCDKKLVKWDDGIWIRFKLFEHILEEAPTIETVSKDQLISEMMEKYNKGLEKAISQKIFSLRSYNIGGKEKRNE